MHTLAVYISLQPALASPSCIKPICEKCRNQRTSISQQEGTVEASHKHDFLLLTKRSSASEGRPAPHAVVHPAENGIMEGIVSPLIQQDHVWISTRVRFITRHKDKFGCFHAPRTQIITVAASVQHFLLCPPIT